MSRRFSTPRAQVVLAILIGLAATLARADVPSPTGGATSRLCLVGGTVVDPDKGTLEQADVVIESATITAIGPRLGTSCKGKKLDLRGKFILPGFIDLHVHGWGNPSPTEDGEQDLGHQAVLALVLRAGVMATLDLAGSDEKRIAVRDATRGSAEHADLYVGAALMARMPRAGKTLPDDGELRARVQAKAKLKPDVIKIISAGGPVAPLVDEARKLGLRTVVHISNWEQAHAAVAAGASAITHFEDEVIIPDDLVQAWAQRAAGPQKIWSIPTMAVQCDLARIADAPARFDDPLFERMTTPALRAAYRDRSHYSDRASGWIRWQSEGCVPNDFETLRKLHRNGITLLAGSDTGNLGTFQGASLHREMELMVEAGIPAWDALRAATSNAAAFLGIKWGFAPGAPANLVVTSAAPIPDIRNTRKIAHVIHRGVQIRLR